MKPGCLGFVQCVFFSQVFIFTSVNVSGAELQLVCALLNIQTNIQKKKGNMYLKYTSLFKRVQAKPPHIDYVLLLFSGLQMVRRSYISWCGRKSAPTEGVRSVSGQRE